MRSGFLPETGERPCLTTLSPGVAAEAHSSVVTYPWQQPLFYIGRVRQLRGLRWGFHCQFHITELLKWSVTVRRPPARQFSEEPGPLLRASRFRSPLPGGEKGPLTN